MPNNTELPPFFWILLQWHDEWNYRAPLGVYTSRAEAKAQQAIWAEAHGEGAPDIKRFTAGQRVNWTATVRWDGESKVTQQENECPEPYIGAHVPRPGEPGYTMDSIDVDDLEFRLFGAGGRTEEEAISEAMALRQQHIDALTEADVAELLHSRIPWVREWAVRELVPRLPAEVSTD